MRNRKKLTMVLGGLLAVLGLVNAALGSTVTGLIVAVCGVILVLRARYGYAAMWASIARRRSS